MFYYLLNHSSLLNKQNEKAKNLSIILFGSLIYLSIHAFLSFNKNTSIQKIKPYFWFMFLLDIVMSYYSFIHKSKDDNDNDNETLDNKKEHSFMEEIFSIKNKITEMISSNKNESYQQENNNNNKTNNKEKTDLQKEKDALILQLKEELNNSNNNNNNNNNTKENIQISENKEQSIIKEEPIKSPKKLSTPIKNLKKNKPNIQQQHQQSQDNGIKETVNNEDEKIINTNKEELDFNDSASESGSEMDFDISEFQNSLDE